MDLKRIRQTMIALGVASTISYNPYIYASNYNNSEHISIEAVYEVGYTTANLNIRKKPTTKSKVIDVIPFNTEVIYVRYNDEWAMIMHNDKIRYISIDYISDNMVNYVTYNTPSNNSFKSFEDYHCITTTNSPHYRYSHELSYTDYTGVRKIGDRYCVALGTGYCSKIGVRVDLVMESGLILKCITSDVKADCDTDSETHRQNSWTNGSIAEFIVDTSAMSYESKNMGDLSYLAKFYGLEEWWGEISYVRVYNDEGEDY